MEQTIQLWMDWSKKKFAKTRAISSITHLREEVEEVVEAIENQDIAATKEEIVDCILCLLSCAGKLGITAKDLHYGIMSKSLVNMTRRWRFDEANKTYKHI
jgi:NTP pyrophosphatase (non-canonical NTP hydrolase)